MEIPHVSWFNRRFPMVFPWFSYAFPVANHANDEAPGTTEPAVPRCPQGGAVVVQVFQGKHLMYITVIYCRNTYYWYMVYIYGIYMYVYIYMYIYICIYNVCIYTYIYISCIYIYHVYIYISCIYIYIPHRFLREILGQPHPNHQPFLGCRRGLFAAAGCRLLIFWILLINLKSPGTCFFCWIRIPCSIHTKHLHSMSQRYVVSSNKQPGFLWGV